MYQASIPFVETIRYLQARGFESVVEGQPPEVRINLNGPIVYVLPNDHRKENSNSKHKILPALTLVREPVRVVWEVIAPDIIKRTGRLHCKGSIDYFALPPEKNVRPAYLGRANKSRDFQTDFSIGASGLLRAPVEVIAKELLSFIE